MTAQYDRTAGDDGRDAGDAAPSPSLEAYLATFDTEPGYLDWAAFGPLSSSVRSEARADIELLGTGRPSSIELVSDHARSARELVGELLGVDAAGVTLQPSTTHGLMQALYGLAGRLLVGRAEFPSLTVSAARAADARGVLSVGWLDPEDGRVTPAVVADALTGDVDALAVSLVDFRTGYRADLTALREVIGDRLLVVDAAQGFGVIEADYSAADVVCGHGYKWVRAGRGTGFAWFGEHALDRLVPALSGISGTDADGPADGVPPASASARAFTVSRSDEVAAARLAAGLRDIAAVGVAQIEATLGDRVDEVIQLADRHDIPVSSPRGRGQRAGIVSLAPAAHEAAPLAAALVNRGVTVTARGGLVRIAPHAGTGSDTLQLLGDALAEFSASRAW